MRRSSEVPLSLILVTMLVSASCSMLEYGIYWFTEGLLQFSQGENLALALVFGVVYVASAQASHGLSRKVGEKGLMLTCMVGQLILAGIVAWWPTKAVVFGVFAGVAVGYGIWWPLIESRFAMGKTPAEATRAIGRFNMSWASTSMIGTAVCGALLGLGTLGFFAVVSLVNIVALVLLAVTMPRHAEPLAADHPDRPDSAALIRARQLLLAARIGMVASYTALFVLAPLLPKVLKNPAFGLTMTLATMLAAVALAIRFLTFLACERWHGWHLKAWPLIFSALALPAGIYLTLFSPAISLFVVGQVMLGLALGFVYVASIDYGMIVKNASVEGGGDHEAVVGLGFTFGPLLGLLGNWLGRFPALGEQGGMALGLVPAVLLSLFMFWPLVRRPA